MDTPCPPPTLQPNDTHHRVAVNRDSLGGKRRHCREESKIFNHWIAFCRACRHDYVESGPGPAGHSERGRRQTCHARKR